MENNISTARKKTGLSQAKVSELLEIPLRTWENWEAGNRKPPIYVEKLIIEKLENLYKNA